MPAIGCKIHLPIVECAVQMRDFKKMKEGDSYI